jgi:peptidoglycan/xylan/chitin deacetylase (PgdA/CDA1 family)
MDKLALVQISVTINSGREMLGNLGESADHFTCALSIDLESWVHRQIGFTIDSNTKRALDNGYIKRAISNILSLLKKYDRRITFFVVSEIFSWYPEVAFDIKAGGHEIAYHTHTHRYVKTKQDLVDELRLSESFLEKFGPVGFRAPEATMTKECLKVLKEYGFEYDSSTYGTLDSSNMINGIREIPISTFSFFNSKSELTLPRNITRKLLSTELPLGSGFFMSALGPAARFLPNLLSFHNKIPVLFIHPWQILTHDTLSLSQENGLFKRVALSLYSHDCSEAFIYLVSHFNTIQMKDLAGKLN